MEVLVCYVCGEKLKRRINKRTTRVEWLGIRAGNLWRHHSCEPGSPKYMANPKLAKGYATDMGFRSVRQCRAVLDIPRSKKSKGRKARRSVMGKPKKGVVKDEATVEVDKTTEAETEEVVEVAVAEPEKVKKEKAPSKRNARINSFVRLMKTGESFTVEEISDAIMKEQPHLSSDTRIYVKRWLMIMEGVGAATEVDGKYTMVKR